MVDVGSLVIPVVLCVIVLGGLYKGVPVFDCFLEGAKDGLMTSVRILPALVALMTAVGMFKASGAMDILSFGLAPVARLLGIPREVIPLALLRPISGSGALAIFQDIIKTYGADSFVGRTASVMQGSTETTFYTIAVYYGATSVKNTRHTLTASLTGDLTGFVLSAIAVRLIFGA